MPKVSVVIPTCNRPELLKRAIRSVLAQTYQDFEVIVVDDGAESAAEAVASFGDVRIHYLKNTGVHGGSAARNRGIEAARGQSIALLDDDDEWLPAKLAVQTEIFEHYPSVGYLFSAAIIRYDDHVETTYVPGGPADYHLRALTRFSGFLTPTLIVRRDLFSKAGKFDEAFPSHQEAEFMIRLSAVALGYGIQDSLIIVSGTHSYEHINRNLSRRIQGRILLLEKHALEFSHYPRLLAVHLRQLAFWQRDVGEFPAAWRSLSKSFVLSPNIKTFLHLIIILFGNSGVRVAKILHILPSEASAHTEAVRSGILQ